MIISLDTETTGIDLRHGAEPYMCTIYDGGYNHYWVWDVDPLTRTVREVTDRYNLVGDLQEIEQQVADADEVILQNPKFDVSAFNALYRRINRKPFAWPWLKTRDTLMAGHLLASNQPHDLTSMVSIYLGWNIQPFETRMRTACLEARALAKKLYPDWRLAYEGEPTVGSPGTELEFAL